MLYITAWIVWNRNVFDNHVTYWPSTEPSIKRCTGVNKRKTCGSMWAYNKNITRTQTAWVSWGQDAEVRASGRQRALGPQWPMVEPTPAKMRKKYCYGQKNFGSICSSLSPSPTPPSHTQPTPTLSRIKCERYIFIKKCVRSFIEVVIIVDYVSAYIMYMYVAILQVNCVLMLNWIVLNRTVFWHWNCTYTKLNCYI